MPPSVGGRAIGRAGGQYGNSEVVFVDYLAPLDKSMSRPLPLKTVKAGGPDGVAPDFLKHLPLKTQKELVYPERELDYGMVSTGLGNSDDCSVIKERERPTSCEQLSSDCSYWLSFLALQ